MTSATPKPRAGEHTKGPWRVGSEVDSAGHVVYINVETHAGKVSCVGVYGHKPNGKTAGQKYTDKFGDERHKPFISEAEARANARRIVACVNACEGIKTENLEHASLDFGKELRADLDEALDALTLLDQAENGPWDGEEQKRHLRTAWSFARDAFAKHGR